MAKTSKELAAHFSNLAGIHLSQARTLETMEPGQAARHKKLASSAFAMAAAHHRGYHPETGDPAHISGYDHESDEYGDMSRHLRGQGSMLRQYAAESEEIAGEILTEVKHYQARLQSDPTMTNRQKYYGALQKLKEYKELTAILG